ncbi:MAG: hypothetical protein ACAH80_18565 [Alphaproteobacteria bacterium]
MKKPLDFSMVANNAKPVTMKALDENDQPIDITGFAIKWQFFAKGDDTAKVTKSTTAGSIIITNGPAGDFAFTLEPEDTVDLDAGEYIHEAVTVDGDGDPVTITNNDPQLSAGKLTLRRQYTVQD